MKKVSVDAVDMFLYVPITFMSNYIGNWAELILDEIFYYPAIGTMFYWVMIFLMKLPLMFLISEFLNRALIGVYATDHYERYHLHDGWFRSFNMLVLPGEIIRFLFSLVSLGHPYRTGAFCRVPAWLFEQDYLVKSGHMDAVRSQLVYTWQDVGAFVLIYLIYFAIHYAYILRQYRRMWLKAEDVHRRILNLPVIMKL